MFSHRRLPTSHDPTQRGGGGREHIYIYVCVYVCMYVCMCIYIYNLENAEDIPDSIRAQAGSPATHSASVPENLGVAVTTAEAKQA